MKRTIFITFLLLAMVSCKNNSKSKGNAESDQEIEQESDGLTLLKGDFIYHDGAAVLQTKTEIYGVLITDKIEELNKMAKAHKARPTDMVVVEVKGKVTKQKDEKILWENKLEIVEILDVKKAKEDNIITLGE